MSTSDIFQQRGHAKIRGILSREMRELARNYMDLSLWSGRMVVSNNDVVSGQFEQYGALLSESLLPLLQSRVESIVGEELIPSYSFWRIYEQGAVLREHVDRAACEIGVSVAIASEPQGIQWPLWVRGLDKQARAINLNPGDAVVYRGAQVPHWRNVFCGRVQYQMFIHYVCRYGPHAQWAYDRRSMCVLPSGR